MNPYIMHSYNLTDYTIEELVRLKKFVDEQEKKHFYRFIQTNSIDEIIKKHQIQKSLEHFIKSNQ
jgi:hypothetical protein